MVRQDFRKVYPFADHFWDRQGLKLHYVDEGKGEPVVMVHGNPTWSFYWRELIKDLSKDHRVVAPDHIGMGLSDKPGDDAYQYTLRSRVEDLDGLLDFLKVREDITLVVHDWGGMIGMNWACRRPERVKRLVVLNTWAFDYPEGARVPPALALARSPLGAFLVRGLNLFSLGAAMTCVKPGSMSGQIFSGYIAPYDSWNNRRAVHRFVQDIPVNPQDPAYDLMKWTGDHLHQFAGKPMLLIWGGRDFVFNDVFYEEWRRRFPKAETLHLPKAGHYVLEDASERIVPEIRAFLARN
ncbi:MAG: alpha/beta fold hydrolase [Elusimicrobia bacterium]|nr:alpha/beta fold hydrolase [Elusimicrobiota bacterium]